MSVRDLAVLLGSSANDNSQPARLLWHNPKAAGFSHPLPYLEGFYYVLLEKDASGRLMPAADCNPGILKAVSRSIRRMERLQGFLGSESLEMGGSALVKASDAGVEPNVTVFTGLAASGQSHHISLKGVADLPKSISAFDKVNIVSGFCLFSNRAFRLEDTSGEIINILDTRSRISRTVKQIHVHDELTLYELESAARLSRTVAAMLASLPATMPTTVTLDIPRVHYYCYPLEAFNDGFVSYELMLRWFDYVDRRHQQVTDSYKHQLDLAFERVCMEKKPALCMAEGLNPLGDVLRRAVRAGSIPGVGELARVMAQTDRIWRLLLEVTEPATYRDLPYLSYAAEQLRAGIWQGSGPRPLMIQVDDYVENKIHQRARKLEGELRKRDAHVQASLLGVYPAENIFMAGRTRHAQLYLHDPGHIFEDDNGFLYSSNEILKRVYGEASVLGSMPL